MNSVISRKGIVSLDWRAPPRVSASVEGIDERPNGSYQLGRTPGALAGAASQEGRLSSDNDYAAGWISDEAAGRSVSRDTLFCRA